MGSQLDKKLLPEFDSIKDTDEEILWLGKPKFVPFILSGLGASLFTIAFGVIWVLVNLNIKPENSAESGWSFFWLFGLIPLGQGVWAFVNRILSFSNTAYAYSQKRVMMRTGFIGTDFKIIDYDKISDIEVTVNVFERAYHVGTVRFFSGRTETNDDITSKLYDRWEAIENPYEVFRRVKQISVDIKTDYNYPNALRPESNPGYHTKYERHE